MSCWEILNTIKNSYKAILNDHLVGIYVHGSIAFHCFNWDKSDIDFIVVVNEALSQKEKSSLTRVLYDLSAEAPPKGLEMSVVLKKYCLEFEYPTPFELHFSNLWMDSYKDNPDKFCADMHGTDKDLAAHFTVIKKAGITLYGLAIDEVFGCVPQTSYVDSIIYDIMDAKSDIRESPMYIILNLCRVLAYVKDGTVTSKEQGGSWGLDHLPFRYKNLIEHALHSYRTNEKMVINDDAAQEFCDYVLCQIGEYRHCLTCVKEQ